MYIANLNCQVLSPCIYGNLFLFIVTITVFTIFILSFIYFVKKARYPKYKRHPKYKRYPTFKHHKFSRKVHLSDSPPPLSEIYEISDSEAYKLLDTYNKIDGTIPSKEQYDILMDNHKKQEFLNEVKKHYNDALYFMQKIHHDDPNIPTYDAFKNSSAASKKNTLQLIKNKIKMGSIGGYKRQKSAQSAASSSEDLYSSTSSDLGRDVLDDSDEDDEDE